MSTELDPFGAPVTVGSMTLRTPGLAGRAEAHPPASAAARSAALTTEELEQALANENVAAQETVELVETQELNVGDVPTRSTAYDEPAIEVEVPDPGAAFGQLVLYVDEAGVTTWNLARDESLAVDATRAAAKRTYVLRRAVPEAPAAAGTRGLVGAVGKKLLKVLVFPLVDPLIGEVGGYFAGKWEAMKRPYRLRSFESGNYASPEAPELGRDDWERLSGGRALLLLHGTLSRAHTAFGALPRDYVEELHRLYEGRVFAFDHYTLSEDPKQNVESLVKQLPEGQALELDVVAHSRGGLVGRVLAEKQSELSLGSRKVSVSKVVFVAAPNAGTVLTDAKYLGDFVDSYTNLLNFFPDTGVVEVIEGVITVVKQLAVGTLKGLEGLQSMRPGGTFLAEWLNAGAAAGPRYFALASNYEPKEAGVATFRDFVMDKIFASTENDLVVPTEGVYRENGSALFPIADRQLFGAADSIPHTRFFASATARDRVLSWLAA